MNTCIDSPTQFILRSHSCYWPLNLMLLSVKISLSPISADAATGAPFSWNFKRLLTQRFHFFLGLVGVLSFPPLTREEKKAARPRTLLQELQLHLAASTLWLETTLRKDSHYVVSELTYQYELHCHCRTFETSTAVYRRAMVPPAVPFFYTLHELPMAAIKTTFTMLVLRLRTAKHAESIAQSERCSCWNCKMLVPLNLQPLLLHPSGLW